MFCGGHSHRRKESGVEGGEGLLRRHGQRSGGPGDPHCQAHSRRGGLRRRKRRCGCGAAGAEPALWRSAVRSGAGGTGGAGRQRRSVLRGGWHGHGGRPGRAPEKAAGYARLPVRGVQAGLLRVHARAVWENRHRGDSPPPGQSGHGKRPAGRGLGEGGGERIQRL